ncbi:hypothetical protein I3271_07315 [Photobacterium leiognathi]|uniref:hypothetical protein n=1 Tax=Photobacterium leiognathi TaxID=553611 RepID=UPI001EDD0AC0|nr:hypothetical protein [Photobacterium leiognathi]MCG3884494.1 hypothetical protein [Photobacterium leiognathi]
MYTQWIALFVVIAAVGAVIVITDSNKPTPPQFVPNLAKLKSSTEPINVVTNTDTEDQVWQIIEPQIEALKKEGTEIQFNAVLFCYIYSLITSLTPISDKTTISSAGDMVKKMFPEDEHHDDIHTAYLACCRDRDFFQRVEKFNSITHKEIEAEQGSFLVRYSRQLNKQ